MDQILEGQAKKCQKSLQKLRKHIEGIGGVEKCATVHNLIIDIIEALENGKSVDDLHNICETLVSEVSDYTDLDLKQHAETFASNVKKLKQKADYQDFMQVMTLDQTSEDALFWTRQDQKQDQGLDFDTLWNGAVYAFQHNEDLEMAYSVFESFANNGYNPACYYLGRMYESGMHVTKDASKAFECYMKGAQDNDSFKADTDCMIRVYYCYENGIGVAKDHKKALMWLESAVDKGSASAMHLMANHILFNDTSRAQRGVELAKKAVDLGYNPANLLLCYAYINGVGVGRNLNTAETYLRAAENAGVDNCNMFRDMLAQARRSGSQQTTQQPKQPTSPGSSSSSSSGCGCLITIALIGLGWYYGWFNSAWNWVSDIFDGSSEKMYVISDKTDVLLDDKSSAQVIGTVKYSDEVKGYEKVGELYRVKANGEEGYIADSCLCTEEEWSLLESMWGDETAKEKIAKANYRKALIEFRKNIITDRTMKIYGSDSDGRNIYTSKKVGENGCLAFIVESRETEERIAVLYLIDSNGNLTMDTNDDTVRSGQYIKSIGKNKKGVYYFQYGGKARAAKKQEAKQQTEKSEQTQPSQSETAPKQETERTKEVTKPVQQDNKQEKKQQKTQQKEPEPEPENKGTGFSLQRVNNIPE